MDAYDIFKKLTKGLKFTKPAIGSQKQQKPASATIKKEEVIIKKEDISEDEESQNLSDNDIAPNPESGSESEGAESEVDTDIQLVDGVKIGKKDRQKKKKEKTEDLKKKLEIEEQNHFRNEYGIKAVGRHIPAALADFSELTDRYHVSDSLVATVRQCGYSEPTPVQRQTLPCMLEDRQLLACAPTGSGKTAAFLVPILHALGAPQGGPRALILCPTRELAVQIYSEALRLSAGAALRVSVVRKMQETKVKEREATIRKSDSHTLELAVQIYSEALRLSAGAALRVSVVRNMQETKVKEREATIRKSDSYTRELAVQIYSEALRLGAGAALRVSVVRNMQETKVKERKATIRKSGMWILAMVSISKALTHCMCQTDSHI
ncbi:hypothetical protein JYU34_005549 [Plutella xylostella]|uniref:ATP-dependent RNA helicase n=1 Tax=Plutella xylostella TaxID=51655 RepID=A0ABQ7QTJ7_PLUXY|nr:hypothetical protein JYU34_005549 [Plutella xylostella]